MTASELIRRVENALGRTEVFGFSTFAWHTKDGDVSMSLRLDWFNGTDSLTATAVDLDGLWSAFCARQGHHLSPTDAEIDEAMAAPEVTS